MTGTLDTYLLPLCIVVALAASSSTTAQTPRVSPWSSPLQPPVVLGPSGLPAPISWLELPPYSCWPVLYGAACSLHGCDGLLQSPRVCTCALPLRRCWGTGVHRCRLACSPGGGGHGPCPQQVGSGPGPGLSPGWCAAGCVIAAG